MRRRSRGLPRAVSAGIVLAMGLGSIPIAANAAPGEDAAALAHFLNADLLPIDAADLGAASASFPSEPGTEADPFNLQALEALGLGVELIGGGLLRVPLLTDGSGPGLLDPGELGAIASYASTESPVSAVAASGAVTDDGTIAVSTGAAPGDGGTASIDLTDLLDQLGVAAVTDALIDEAAIEVGALASRAEHLPGTAATSEYRVTDLGLELHSPAVATMAQSLRDTLTNATTGLTEGVTALAGPGGAVSGVVDAVSDLSVLGLVTVSLGDAEVAVTPPDLAALVDGVLGGPGAVVVSDDGAVTVDLVDGSISVDLANLVNPGGPNLNGLPANTQALTAETIAAITAGATNALGKVVGNVTAGLEAALRSTSLALELGVVATALGIELIDAPVVISGTLAQFAAGTPTVDTSGLTLLPGVPLCLGATVAGTCLGLNVNTVLQPVLSSVVDTLVPQVLSSMPAPLAGVVTASTAEITGRLDGVVAGLLGALAPALDGLLANVATITINEQPAVGDLGPGSFTVRALSVGLLPNTPGSTLVSLDLASSTVRALDALPGPMLTALAPDSGPAAGGTEVTITGTDLAGATEVVVDGEPVAFTQAGETELTFETPAHAPGAAQVVVIADGGTTNALPFEYVAPPAITTLAPAAGPAVGGTLVTVSGSDLDDATGVTLDGAEVPFTQVSDVEVTFVTPAHAPGAVDVVVETVGGTSAPLGFTYVPAPVLTSLEPAAGPSAGGTSVIVEGDDLAGATGVMIDGERVAFTQVRETEVRFITPAHAPGEADVVVTTSGGPSAPLTYTFIAPPALAELDPEAGPAAGGTSVTVTGARLAGAAEVAVDGRPVAFSQLSDTAVTFVTPAHAPGEVEVTVTAAGGASDPLTYTYLGAPAVTAMDPGEGPTDGGTLVVVTGTGLSDPTAVTVDGAAVPFVEFGGTVYLLTPAHEPGPAGVVVETVGGSSAPATFTYVPEPALIELDPDAGPASGGTTVTISGTGLAGALEVALDGAPVPFTQVSDSRLTFVTAPHAAGEVDVTVGTAGGISEPLPFTFVPSPVLLELDPDRGPVAGGTTVTITGDDLARAVEVRIDGAPVPFTPGGTGAEGPGGLVTLPAGEALTFVTPPHAPGPVDVTVTTVGGVSAPLAFTYLDDGVTSPPGDGGAGAGPVPGPGADPGARPGPDGGTGADTGVASGTGAGTTGSVVGGLAATGAEVEIPLVAALGVVLGGLAFVVAARRRAGAR